MRYLWRLQDILRGDSNYSAKKGRPYIYKGEEKPRHTPYYPITEDGTLRIAVDEETYLKTKRVFVEVPELKCGTLYYMEE